MSRKAAHRQAHHAIGAVDAARMVEAGRADRDQHVDAAGGHEAGPGEHDGGQGTRRLEIAEAREPEQAVDGTGREQRLGTIAPAIVIGRTGGQARAQRHARLPGTDLVDADDVVRPGERKAGRPRVRVEAAQQGGQAAPPADPHAAPAARPRPRPRAHSAPRAAVLRARPGWPSRHPAPPARRPGAPRPNPGAPPAPAAAWPGYRASAVPTPRRVVPRRERRGSAPRDPPAVAPAAAPGRGRRGLPPSCRCRRRAGNPHGSAPRPTWWSPSPKSCIARRFAICPGAEAWSTIPPTASANATAARAPAVSVPSPASSGSRLERKSSAARETAASSVVGSPSTRGVVSPSGRSNPATALGQPFATTRTLSPRTSTSRSSHASEQKGQTTSRRIVGAEAVVSSVIWPALAWCRSRTPRVSKAHVRGQSSLQIAPTPSKRWAAGAGMMLKLPRG